MITAYRVTSIVIFLLLMASANFSQERSPYSTEIAYRSPFRYVIVDNEVDPDPVEQSRYVEVLMDKKAFSKENLKTLFELVSARYLKPNLLDVKVFTNLEDVETPEERDHPKNTATASGGPPQQETAIFTRYGKSKSFIISRPDGTYEKVTMN